MGLEKLARRLQNPGFASNVLTLMTGTMIAQAIPVAISPILTRIYSPDDYGIFALFMSISSIAAATATLRYDMAVMLPKEDDDAINIVVLSIILAVGISIIALIVVSTMNSFITEILKKPGISSWLYFIPLTILFNGISQPLYNWLNRKRAYRQLALNSIWGSASAASCNLAMGVAKAGVGGLITGNLIGQGISAGYLGWRIWIADEKMLSRVDYDKLSAQIKRYLKFPIYSLPADLVNVTTQQVPIILIGSSFGADIVGLFYLTQRVLGTPLILISASVLGVFRERASSDYIQYGNCKDIYVKTFKGLLALSVGPFLFFFALAPLLFSLVFGHAWKEAGEYARILSPLFFIRFFASPLSYVMYIVEKQNYDLIGQIGLFVSAVCSIMAGVHFGNPKISLICFSASYSLIYVTYLGVSYRMARGHR